MRYAGQNPTDIEVQDFLNKIDDGSGTLNVEDFIGFVHGNFKKSIIVLTSRSYERKV